MAIGRRKIIYGVGINDADYQVYKCRRVDGKMVVDWVCPYYSRWLDMIRRCYSKKQKDKQKNYEQSTTSEEWKTFSNFKAWMEQQDWESKHLDKDLKKSGNFVYSEENCLFIDPTINNLIINKGNTSGLPRGVSRDKKRFTARLKNIDENGEQKKLYLGVFDTPYEAHKTYLLHLNLKVSRLIENQEDQVVDLVKRWFNELVEESELNCNLFLEDLKYAV